jgi:hypothetical protein
MMASLRERAATEVHQARAWLPLVALLLGAGCARHMGGGASKGAFQGLREESESGHPMTDVGHNVTVGALQSLSEPEQLARMQTIVAATTAAAISRALETATRGGQPGEGSLVEIASGQAAEAFRTTLARGLRGDLDPEGGTLGASATALTRAMTASAVTGALGAMLPGCDPRADPECVRRHFRLLAHDAGESLVSGAWDALGIWPLVIAFALGGIVVVLVAGLVRALRRGPRYPQPRGLPAPAPS